MRIAFTSRGNDWNSMIDPRFGRTDFIIVYDEETREIELLDNRSVSETAHGAGPQTAKKLIDLNPDVLITGNGPGGNAETVLRKGGFPIYSGAGQMTVKGALIAFKNNELKEF